MLERHGPIERLSKRVKNVGILVMDTAVFEIETEGSINPHIALNCESNVFTGVCLSWEGR